MNAYRMIVLGWGKPEWGRGDMLMRLDDESAVERIKKAGGGRTGTCTGGLIRLMRALGSEGGVLSTGAVKREGGGRGYVPELLRQATHLDELQRRIERHIRGSRGRGVKWRALAEKEPFTGKGAEKAGIAEELAGFMAYFCSHEFGNLGVDHCR